MIPANAKVLRPQAGQEFFSLTCLRSFLVNAISGSATPATIITTPIIDNILFRF